MLRPEAGGRSSLRVELGEGATLGALLDEIGASWPQLERRIRDERGALHRYVNLYIDGEECRRLDGLRTPLSGPAEILVVPSVAGG